MIKFKFFKILLLLSIIQLCAFLNSYAQVNYPVGINTVIEAPYSPYFSDYFSSSASKWKGTLIFNDFSEPLWDVKLKITIESNNLKIKTRSEFIPPVSIKIFPGVPVQISGADLAPYFNYNNLILNGITASELSRNGKFPEGFYSFCIEVLDYRSGTSLSLKSCSNIWIQLNDEPIAITPGYGSVVAVTPAQNIIFQWHQSNAVSPNSIGTEYQLTLYEITDPLVNPLNAIQNNKVLKIFESGFLNQNTFLYDMTAPMLDVGKKYAYTIQARDIEGKDVFKNKGTSQACWFYYGYPLNGNIILRQPADQAALAINDPVYFKWSKPGNLLQGQFFSYCLKIVKVDPDQNPEDALLNNPAWHEETSASIARLNDYDLLINKKLDPQITYAWQVTAITEGQEIAKSQAYIFHGPGIIEKFIAGNHEVLVRSTFNKDLNNLSGVGIVKLSQDGKSQEVNFSNLRLKEVAGQWVLQSGTIISNVNDTSLIELNPDMEENSIAWFHPKKFKLDKDALMLQGYVTWDLPHAVTSSEKAVVTSDITWVNFNKFKLYGKVVLNGKNKFNLLDPYNFNLNLFATSEIYLNYNKYFLFIDGEIVFPEIIKGSNPGSGRVAMPFKRAGQLYYITNTDVNAENNILLIQGTNMVMKPKSIIIDLSEIRTQGKLSDNPSWKGVYVEKFRIDFNKDLDKYGQFSLSSLVSENFELNNSNEFINWISNDGLNFFITKIFSANEKASFNQFPAKFNKIRIEIEKNSVKNSSIKGSIIVPVISTTKEFSFTAPVFNSGFYQGYLDDIDGTSFTFNKGAGEQEIQVTITRAVFSDREKLDMTLDLEWPALSVGLTALTGFKAYGNYDIGFLRPNGAMTLSSQVKGEISTFPVTFDGIGAGSSNGAYAIGLTGKVVMAEDVSGADGAPSVNIYSTVPNEMLSKVPYDGRNVNMGSDNEGDFISSNTSSKTIEDNIDIIKNSFVSKITQAGIEASFNEDTFTGDLRGQGSTTNYDIREITGEKTEEPGSSTYVNVSLKFNFNQEKLYKDIRVFISEELAREATDPINQLANKFNANFLNRVNPVRDSLNKKIDERIHKLCDTLAARFIKSTKTDSLDPTEIINKIAKNLAIEISREITGAVNQTVAENITGPVTSFVSNEIAGKVIAFINTQTDILLTDILEGKAGKTEAVDNVVNELPEIIKGIGEKTVGGISFEKAKDKVINTGLDLLGNISVSVILEKFSAALIKDLTGISGGLSGLVSKKASQLASDLINGGGSGPASVGIGIKMNFDNLGRNLSEGRVDKIVKLDPVSIALNTKFVSFSGLIYHSAADPVYGDVWRGDVAFKVNVPKPFSLAGTYVNGRKDDFSYWFCQISGANDTKPAGEILPQNAKELSTPAPLGLVDLVAVAGRLYHHMTDAPGKPIVPDINTKYGAYINCIFFDHKKKGKVIRLDAAAGIEIREDGNYVVEFAGNMQSGNSDPQILTIDPGAAVAGGINIRYNSAESHFLGRGWVIVNKDPIICASGSILLDVKPGAWRLAIGNRNERLIFIPGCAGWSPTGWLDVNQSTAELGLGVQLSIYASAGFDFGAIALMVGVDAGVAAGILAVIQYDPSFALHEAGVWVELWGRVFINYSIDFKLVKKSGSITLVDIYCRGELTVRFQPAPTTAQGQLAGHVEVLGLFGCDFDAGFEKKFN